MMSATVFQSFGVIHFQNAGSRGDSDKKKVQLHEEGNAT